MFQLLTGLLLDLDVKSDVQEVIDALSDGRLDMAQKMITKRINMDEVLEEGFLTLINDKE